MAMGWQGWELKTFLIDAWELFYWSLWCPSRLQERMNQIHGKDRTNGFDIFLLDSSKKKDFVKQYFFVSLILAIPIIILAIYSSKLNWLLLFTFVTLISPSGIGIWFLPKGVGWSAPLLFLISAWVNPILLEKIFDEGKIESLQVFSSPQQAFIGLVIGITILFLSSWIGSLLVRQRLDQNWRFFENSVSAFVESIVVASISIFSGSIVATGNLLTSSLLTVSTGFFVGSLKEYLEINSSESYTFIRNEEISSIFYRIILVAFLGITSGFLCFSALGITLSMLSKINSVALFVIVAVVLGVFVGVIFLVMSAVKSSIATSLASVLSMITAAVIALVVIAVSKLPLLFYLIACAILAFVSAGGKNHNCALTLIVMMLMLGFENLQTHVFWIIPIIVLFYYRIFPDYLLSIAFPLLYTIPVILAPHPKHQRFSIQHNALSLAKNLPLLNSELVWLPIPQHDAILASAFQQSPVEALKIYQTLQVNPLPGARITLYNALPDIVANCLQAARNTDDLLQIKTEYHPQLPLLIPEYYQSTTDGNLEKLTAVKRRPEIVIIFPLLQNLIQNTRTALSIGVIALRERELEQIFTDTKLLSDQLPSLLPATSVPRWQSVLIRWQHILELELIEQHKQSQGELLSPFQYGNPLKPHDAFKGRRTLADRLYRLVLDRNRPTLVLHGPRRFGKTSFLNNLSRLLPTDLIPIYLDLQSSAISNSEADFCYGLIRAINKDTRSQNLTLPSVPPRDDFKTNPYATLEDWLDQALPQIPEGRRLLLNLDEFEKLGTAITTGRLSLRLLDQLRNLIQHRDELAFMFSGVQTLDELGPNWSSYFISVVPIEMGYLEPSEAEDLLRNPDPDFKMGYEEGLVETIIHLTHCQPYLLQLIGASLVDQANQAQVKTATHALLESAIPEAFTNGEPYFTNLWTEFTGTTPDEIQAGQQMLRAITQNHPPDLTTPAAQSAHRRLQRFHILTDNDRIEIPLFERWVKDRSIDSIG